MNHRDDWKTLINAVELPEAGGAVMANPYENQTHRKNCGCSACAPITALLARLGDRPDPQDVAAAIRFLEMRQMREASCRR